jgi:hypothetical protein
VTGVLSVIACFRQLAQSRYYVRVQRVTKRRVLEFVLPVFLGVGFIVKMVYHIALGWWLEPRLQRKANRELLDDVHANLPFLASQAQMDSPGPITVLPFDYASVEIPWENLLFTISRGREELNISVAPRHAPHQSYELGPVIAALDGRHFSQRDLVKDLAGAATLLHPRLQALNAAFSVQEFPRIKERLW